LRSRLGETICGIYDNCTTIRIQTVEDPVRRLSDPLSGVIEKVSVALEHHPRIGVAEAASNSEGILACLDQPTNLPYGGGYGRLQAASLRF